MPRPAIAGSPDAWIYHTERVGMMGYSLPGPPAPCDARRVGHGHRRRLHRRNHRARFAEHGALGRALAARHDPQPRDGIFIDNGADGTVGNAQFDDMRFEVVCDNFSRCTAARGHVDGVTVTGLRRLNGPAVPAAIDGYDAAHEVANVAFHDVWQLGNHVTTPAAGIFSQNAFTSNVTFAP